MPSITSPLLLAADSALRHLPVEISREQALFFDGIRFTAQTAVLSHTRLLASLDDIGRQRLADHSTVDEHLVVGALTDAWTIVDAVHRLRSLLQQMPGWRKNAAGARAFAEHTKDVEGLRHFMQHLNNEVKPLVATGVPLLGFIQWVAKMSESGPSTAFMLVPGTVGTFEQDVVVNTLEPLGGSVGQVRLVAGGVTLWLAPLVDRVRDLATSIEAGLGEYKPQSLRRSADLVVEITLPDLRVP